MPNQLCFQAVETLKMFEKKDSRVKSAAATNLSFLYFLVSTLLKSVDLEELVLIRFSQTCSCFVSSICLFLCLLQEKDFEQADRYAELAMSADRYNPAALVNKGNTEFVKEDYEKAAEFYKEALRNDSSCTEALYNLGLLSQTWHPKGYIRWDLHTFVF